MLIYAYTKNKEFQHVCQLVAFPKMAAEQEYLASVFTKKFKSSKLSILFHIA